MDAEKPSDPQRSVCFLDWAEVLAQSDLSETTREQYRTALFCYLRFCEQTRQGATVASARQFMQERQAK